MVPRGCEVTMAAAEARAQYSAILLGATGNVGGRILQLLIKNPLCKKVVVVTRRKTDFADPKVAEVGRLTLAVSGPRPAFDTAQPYLDLLGAGATYVGEGELARTVKICHNLFLGVVTQSLAEVTILAEKSGISYEAVLQRIINLGLRWQPESVA